MSAPVVDVRDAMVRRLREGHRVSDVAEEFEATRPKVHEAALAAGLLMNPARDTFEDPTPADRAVVRPVPTPRPQEAPVSDAAKYTDGWAALRDRIAALDVDAKTLRTWARLRRIDVPATGMLPARVVDAYEQWIAAGRPAPEMPPPPGPPPRPVLESAAWEDLGQAAAEPEPEPHADDEPVVRVVAVAVGTSPALLAAILTAAVGAGDFGSLSVEDGWIYLEQAAS